MAESLNPLRKWLSSRRVTAAVAALKASRYSLAISLAVTLLGLFAYVSINFSENLHSAFVFLDAVEARTLDARFRYRGTVQPDPNIGIIAVDQKTVDQMGWPIARSHYGRMLRTLARDGARAVGFDIDFATPDRASGAGIFAQVEKEYRSNHAANDKFLERLNTLRAESDSDAQFAKAIEESGIVVLGHLFFTNSAEIAAMEPAQIKAYNELLAFQQYPQTLLRANTKGFHVEGPTYVAVEPNLHVFAEKAKSFGSFNFDADADGTFRRSSLIFPYIDSQDRKSTRLNSSHIQKSRMPSSA